MTRAPNRLPARRTDRTAAGSAGRDVVYLYQQQGIGNGLTVLTPAEAAARARTDRILYARWAARHAAQAERDRHARRFWLAAGITVGLGLLAGLGVAGWIIYHAVAGAAASIGGALLIAGLVIGGVPLLAIGGHKCVTTVTHRH